jgi:hypothetical protein
MPENPAPPNTKRCPFCAEEILAAAIKCKHCQSILGGAPVPQPGPAAGQTEGIGAASERFDAPGLPAGYVICRACGYCGKGQAIGCLQAVLVVILLLFFIVPGIAYLVYLNYLKGACPTCGKHEVIPANSETGQVLFAARQQRTASTPTPAERGPEPPIARPPGWWHWPIALLAIGGTLVAILLVSRPHAMNDGATRTSAESTPAAGYVVVMKDGTRVRTKGPYKVEANVAILTLEDGTLAYHGLDSIDREATETANAKQKGAPGEARERERDATEKPQRDSAALAEENCRRTPGCAEAYQKNYGAAIAAEAESRRSAHAMPPSGGVSINFSRSPAPAPTPTGGAR